MLAASVAAPPVMACLRRGSQPGEYMLYAYRVVQVKSQTCVQRQCDMNNLIALPETSQVL